MSSAVTLGQIIPRTSQYGTAEGLDAYISFFDHDGAKTSRDPIGSVKIFDDITLPKSLTPRPFDISLAEKLNKRELPFIKGSLRIPTYRGTSGSGFSTGELIDLEVLEEVTITAPHKTQITYDPFSKEVLIYNKEKSPSYGYLAEIEEEVPNIRFSQQNKLFAVPDLKIFDVIRYSSSEIKLLVPLSKIR